MTFAEVLFLSIWGMAALTFVGIFIYAQIHKYVTGERQRKLYHRRLDNKWRDYQKVLDVIQSCTTYHHTLAASKMIKHWDTLHSPKFGDRTRWDLEIMNQVKAKEIRDEDKS